MRTYVVSQESKPHDDDDETTPPSPPPLHSSSPRTFTAISGYYLYTILMYVPIFICRYRILRNQIEEERVPVYIHTRIGRIH